MPPCLKLCTTCDHHPSPTPSNQLKAVEELLEGGNYLQDKVTNCLGRGSLGCLKECIVIAARRWHHKYYFSLP